jgi:hypothetical protein
MSSTDQFPFLLPERLPIRLNPCPIVEAIFELRFSSGQPWANYWTLTIVELRSDLVSSGKLNGALVDAFLGYCADPNWWTQTITFTAVHARARRA